jgi:hypothetical protein
MKLWKLAGSLGLVGLLASCAATAGSEADDADVADDDAESTEEALTAGTATFYALRHDYRRCMYPLCGGYWVSRVNFAKTRCADGQWADACYVADLDLGATRLPATVAADATSDISRIVVRASLKKKTIGSFSTSVLRASEVWRAPEAGTATGTFYRVEDSGLRCITAPCPSTQDRKLNSSAQPRALFDVDLSAAPGTASDKSDALATVMSHGLVVAGTHKTVAGKTRLEGTQFYTRVVGALAQGDACTAGDTCGAGLACCYPCGIQGCENRCMATTASGECPLIP